MKYWRLRYQRNDLLIEQIDWLSRLNCIDLNADDIKSLASKSKTQLIEIWINNYKSLDNPQEKWLEIYF
jgi:hypothetical protein